MVFGDNGAEGTDLFKIVAGSPGTRDFLIAAVNFSQTHPNAWGDPDSYVGYGPMWAQVSMTPLSQYKGWTAEGGIRNGLIVSGPDALVKRAKGGIAHGFMHVADIMPTVLEIAGTYYPEVYEGKRLPPLAGISWRDVLLGVKESPRDDTSYMAWEIFGNRALRQGDWKLRWQYKPFGKGDWELFNLARDPGERFDLAQKNPQKLAQLIGLWDDYVRNNNVILPSRSPFETLEDTLPSRVPQDAGYPRLIYRKQFEPPKDMMSE